MRATRPRRFCCSAGVSPAVVRTPRPRPCLPGRNQDRRGRGGRRVISACHPESRPAGRRTLRLVFSLRLILPFVTLREGGLPRVFFSAGTPSRRTPTLYSLSS